MWQSLQPKKHFFHWKSAKGWDFQDDCVGSSFFSPGKQAKNFKAPI